MLSYEILKDVEILENYIVWCVFVILLYLINFVRDKDFKIIIGNIWMDNNRLNIY